jgi:hypothetical protein
MIDVHVAQLPIEPGEDVRGVFRERVQLPLTQPHGGLRFLQRSELLAHLVLTRAGANRSLHCADQGAGGRGALQHGDVAQRAHGDARQFRQLIVSTQDNGGDVGPRRLAAEGLEYLVDVRIG